MGMKEGFANMLGRRHMREERRIREMRERALSDKRAIEALDFAAIEYADPALALRRLDESPDLLALKRDELKGIIGRKIEAQELDADNAMLVKLVYSGALRNLRDGVMQDKGIEYEAFGAMVRASHAADRERISRQLATLEMLESLDTRKEVDAHVRTRPET